MVYHYTVGVYDYESHTEIWFTHEEKYSHHEFVLIIQEGIDDIIKEYGELEEYEDNSPCMLDTYDILRLPSFYKYMSKKGFKQLKVTASCALEDRRIFNNEFNDMFIKGRYDKLSLGHCKECFKDDDEECPVANNRR